VVVGVGVGAELWLVVGVGVAPLPPLVELVVAVGEDVLTVVVDELARALLLPLPQAVSASTQQAMRLMPTMASQDAGR
jgi:hypothetical protein